MDAIVPLHNQPSCAVLPTRHRYELDLLMQQVCSCDYGGIYRQTLSIPYPVALHIGDIKQIMRFPMDEEKHLIQAANKRPRGRPRTPSQIARPNRLVTFVTDKEMEYLMRVVAEEDRSMASVIHRIIAAHIGGRQKNV
jgi:hypothetical protein